MKTIGFLIAYSLFITPVLHAQTTAEAGDFKIALPGRSGQLQWHAAGFKAVELSAKPNGNEIGVRGANPSGSVTFLGFLFVFTEQAPMTGAKCRDGILNPEKKASPTLTVSRTSRIDRGADDLPVEVVSYSTRNNQGKSEYTVRSFIAAGDLCGDIAVYSETAVTDEDNEVRQILQSIHYDPKYVPQFTDVLLYGQILFQHHMYEAAGPVFEAALVKLNSSTNPDPQTMRRAVTDQAGMSYGISGNLKKARAIFENAIKGDPDYAFYYYNLACADAEENNLAAARTHLEQAFSRKKNVLPGESLPDPAKDDSFIPHRNNKEFWTFVESLH
jgi:hypothetical protein